MKNSEIIVLKNLEELSRATAAKFVELTKANTGNGYSFNLALSGGTTPQRLYSLLADQNEDYCRAVDWSKVNFFWGDERCVPLESEESNFRMVNEILLNPLGISPEKIYRFKSEIDPSSAAAEYEKLLRLLFNTPYQSVPHFDLIFLGMGADGHTASLFPGSEVIDENEKFAVAPFVEKLSKYRLTLTPLIINNAANIIFQVAGAEKAEVLREVLEGEYNPHKFPAQIVNPKDGKVFWFLDEAAAESLTINRNYENFTGYFRR